MFNYSSKIVAPIPVYSADLELLGRLSKELQEERERTYSLARDLAIEKHKTQQLECYLLSLTNLGDNKPKFEDEEDTEKRGIPKNESMETFASISDLNEIHSQIGIYSTEIRKNKILKYKEKIKKYRQKVHVSRNFSGRSIVAKIKPRVNGKFVKSTPSQDCNDIHFV